MGSDDNAMRPLEPYHYAWMAAAGVAEEQLRAWLKAGFDIHHIDGDHSNNHELNLVLIWGADHMMLHNGSKRLSRIRARGPRLTRVTTRKQRRRDFKCGCCAVGKQFTACNGQTFVMVKHTWAGMTCAAFHGVATVKRVMEAIGGPPKAKAA